MNAMLRYILAVILGIGISVLSWQYISTIHPIFIKLQASGLVAPVFSSILGGFVVAVLSPNYKIRMSALIGSILSVPILFYLLHNGFSHLGRNPFFWYWPAYVIPSFIVGGFLGRGLWRHV